MLAIKLAPLSGNIYITRPDSAGLLHKFSEGAIRDRVVLKRNLKRSGRTSLGSEQNWWVHGPCSRRARLQNSCGSNPEWDSPHTSNHPAVRAKINIPSIGAQNPLISEWHSPHSGTVETLSHVTFKDKFLTHKWIPILDQVDSRFKIGSLLASMLLARDQFIYMENQFLSPDGGER